MRPIVLKMKGLNSFIEEQAIDFSKLMEQGLFGIFGPTGSGKTTILDGITLALYGEIARKSKNFININCKSASILFEFQISGAEWKKYRVEREFRQDANQEGYKTGMCRLSDITGDTPVILADKVTEVNKACTEIIGLKSDDFQRTVVLPQGRFSEFLKLEGKKRSEMLERLFCLQAYGDELTKKLKAESDKIEHKRSKLEGQLQAYADISEECLKEKKQEAERQKEELEHHTKALEELLVQYENGKEIWNLQLEREKQLEQRIQLDKEQSQIESLEERIAVSRKANKVYPFIQSLEYAEKEKTDKEAVRNQVKTEYDESEKRKLDVEGQYKILKRQREEELPVLRQNIQGLREAIEYQAEYFQIGEQYEKQELLYRQKEKKLKEISSLEEHLKQTIENYGKMIEELRKKQKKYGISPQNRQQIQTGISLEQQYDMLSERMEREEAELEKLQEEKDRQEETLYKMEQILFGEKAEIPEDMKTYQLHLQEMKEKKKEYEAGLELVNRKGNELAACLNKLGEVKEKKAELQEEAAQIKLEKEKMEVETLSYTLRQTLQDGKPCPVCGSLHHMQKEVYQIDSEKLVEIKKVYDRMEQKIREQENKEAVLENSRKQTEEELQELKQKLKEIEPVSISMTQEEIEWKLEILSRYHMEKASYDFFSKSFTDKEDYIIKERERFRNCKNSLEELLREVAFPSFKEAAQKMQQCDEKLEEIFRTLQKGVEQEKSKREELENNRELRNQLETELAIIGENQKNGAERQTILVDKFVKSISFFKETSIEDVTLRTTLEEYLRKQQQIESQYQEMEEKKDKETRYFAEMQKKLAEVSSACSLLQKQIEEETEQVLCLLKQEQFETKESCLNAMLPETEIQDMQDKIDRYKNESAKNRGVLDKIERQLNGRAIGQDEWVGLETRKQEEERVCGEVRLAYSNLFITLERLQSDWEKQKRVVIQLKEVEHRQSLMADLMQLFRGKKFVEYVAYSKLQYISKAASHRLRDISNGNYGLELDPGGRFMVCDYKNGGVKRDAFTLSGGETFLVSLSLALALSEQVQLKGTAPLELFFLDEGFGTLDDELLEVVMNSLERLQNKHLTVGIISHVEAVKSRVPVKLTVFPSVAGLGGTKVRIEKN